MIILDPLLGENPLVSKWSNFFFSFEFLAGNMDENYPVVARPKTTRYGIW
jgi:hypothetical protein